MINLGIWWKTRKIRLELKENFSKKKKYTHTYILEKYKKEKDFNVSNSAISDMLVSHFQEKVCVI